MKPEFEKSVLCAGKAGAVANKVENAAFRFSIVHLLYLTTLLAAAIAMFEWYAGMWLFGVAVFWGLMFGMRHSVKSVAGCLAILLLLLLLTAWALLPAVQRVREAARRTQCLNIVRQLGLSIWNYQSAMQTLPPAYKTDGNGEPMHSWRVMILPFVEQVGIFNRYKFDEPWDGPNNSKLIDQLVGSGPFCCPASDCDQSQTHYKLVTGSGTAFDGDLTVTTAQMQSTTNTILIIEDIANPVCWMEPKDLTVQEAIKLFDMKQTTIPHHVFQTKFIRRIHYHRHVAMFDGSVRSVGFLADPEQIVPCLMLNDPAKKDFNELEFIYPEPEVTILYSGYFLLAFNILLAVLPCFWKRLQPLAHQARSASE